MAQAQIALESCSLENREFSELTTASHCRFVCHGSHVLAAYAGFLWETEEEDGGGSQDFMVESARSGGLAPATA